MSKCCNNNCNQGRNCKNEQFKPNWPFIAAIGACFVFWAIVISAAFV